MKPKFKLALALFVLGFLGILSMLTVKLPIDSLPKDLIHLSPIAIKALSLANPTILLLIAIAGGTALYNKVKLTVPTISALLKIESSQIKFTEQLKSGITLGLLSGILIIFVSFISNLIIPDEFEALNKNIDITLLARFLYGGFTEELLLRFGFMTFVVWCISKIMGRLNTPIYWIGIILSTILFAIGHFPIVFSTIAHPSIILLTYILIGNSIPGLVCGWLYWKKGLEAAFIAHVFAHVAMVVIVSLIS